MPDPSPDTPNVCPTAEVLVRAQFVDGEVWLVDDEGNEVGVMARSTFDRCVARPAAGSSSPDVAALHTRIAHGDACPHGFPSKASCVDCMASGAVSAPTADASGSAERADSHPFNGRYDKDCPVCHFTMLDAPIVHTTCNRYAHVACVDKREADRG